MLDCRLAKLDCRLAKSGCRLAKLGCMRDLLGCRPVRLGCMLAKSASTEVRSESRLVMLANRQGTSSKPCHCRRSRSYHLQNPIHSCRFRASKPVRSLLHQLPD